MVQIDTRPDRIRSAVLEDAADIVGETMTHARKAAGSVAGQAQDMIETAAESIGAAVDDIDPADVERGARHALRRLRRTSAADCSELIADARSRERLKSALIAGVVVFILSSVAFVIAREIASRRAAEQGRRSTTAGASTVEPTAATTVDVGEAR